MSLTVSNLTLDVESRSGKCAIGLADGVTLDLTVKGTNTLASSSAAPGIAVYSGRTINISGDENSWLTAQGGKNAAGIGGGRLGTSSGKINISGGRITAIGGANAAGIGGGQEIAKAGAVTISGGIVTARGGQYAAAIGGGHTGCADVTITGGTVFPTAGTKASAIGNGYDATGSGNNTFGFAAIYAAKDAVSPAAKNGSGKAVFPVSLDMGTPNCKVTSVVIEDEAKTCRDLWTDANGKLTLWLEPTDGNQYTITITAVDSDGDETVKSFRRRLGIRRRLRDPRDLVRRPYDHRQFHERDDQRRRDGRRRDGHAGKSYLDDAEQPPVAVRRLQQLHLDALRQQYHRVHQQPGRAVREPEGFSIHCGH